MRIRDHIILILRLQHVVAMGQWAGSCLSWTQWAFLQEPPLLLASFPLALAMTSPDHLIGEASTGISLYVKSSSTLPKLTWLAWIGGPYRCRLKPIPQTLKTIATVKTNWYYNCLYLSERSEGLRLTNRFVILQPLSVLNNYFSVGIDAHIALQFHRARNNNPDHFTSRTRNLLFYGIEGGKDLFKQQWRTLMDYVSIECDGEDYTQRLKAYGTHSVLFLNIKVRFYTFPDPKIEKGKEALS